MRLQRALLSSSWLIIATLLLFYGSRGAAAQDTDPGVSYPGLSELDLSGTVSLPQMYLGVVDVTGAPWCTTDLAKEVRSAIMQCLVTMIPYKCNIYPNSVLLRTARCYGDSAVTIDGGSMDFSQSLVAASGAVPSNYVVNTCVKETIRTAECSSQLQAVLPNAASLSYGYVTMSPTTNAPIMAATPAPTPLRYTPFPTAAPTTARPTFRPTTRPPSLRPTRPQTDEPTFQLDLTTTEQPTQIATNEPTVTPPTTKEPSLRPTEAAVETKQPTGVPSAAAAATEEPTVTPLVQDDDDGEAPIAIPDDDTESNDGNNTDGNAGGGGGDDELVNKPSTITSSPKESRMSPFTIGISAAAGAFVLLCLVGGAVYRRGSKQQVVAAKVTDQEIEEDDQDSSKSSYGRWLYSASVSNIYKSTDDSEDAAASSQSKTGYYFGSGSQSTGSPDRPARSLTEQDHLGASADMDDDDNDNVDLEQPTSPAASPKKVLVPALAGAAAATATIPFRPLRDDKPSASASSPAKTETSMASLDSMQHSDSEASSQLQMTLSDSSVEPGDQTQKTDKYGRNNVAMKAYKNTSPPPEQARGNSFFRKKNPFNFHSLYGGASNRSASDDDDDEEQEQKQETTQEEQPSQENALNTTNYELDVNWNPDDNSVTSSDRGDDIFTPTSSKEGTFMLPEGNEDEEEEEEGIEVAHVYEALDEVPEESADSNVLLMNPGSPPSGDFAEPADDDKERSPPHSPPRLWSVLDGQAQGPMASSPQRTSSVEDTKSNSPPRSNGHPSTNSSLSSSRSSPIKTSTSSSNSSFSSGADHLQSQQQPAANSTTAQGARDHPPLSPGKRARVMIDPLAGQGPAVFATDTLATAPLLSPDVPRSHFADSGSFTDKPSAPRPRPPSPSGGFMMVPLSPDYAEV